MKEEEPPSSTGPALSPSHHLVRGDDPGLAYDVLAPRYDGLREENVILDHVARVSSDLVLSAMRTCDRLLDIGCGTGREALLMASKGKEVVACDPSEESLRILERKARERGLGGIQTRILHASELGALEEEFGQSYFDGAYSSFALSYEPHLPPIARSLHGVLRPGAPFLGSLYNRICLAELLLLAPLFVPRRALHRLLGTTSLPVDRFDVRIWSHTVSDVKRAFGTRFALLQTWALPAILPPNYLHLLVDILGGFRGDLERLDRAVNGSWPFRVLGSHTAFLFKAIG